MKSSAINIGPGEVRKRRLMGMVGLAAAVGLAFVAVFFGTPRWARVFVFIPAWVAGLGLFQAKEKTCIALAARGACNMDAGEESIEDENRIAQLRVKARQINRRALITAALITALTVAFP
ncbi:MAG TPA: hypothetical protein VF791_07235 [Pyrinomonadaceae bacterium]